ncbi:Tetratricopeptide repeat protein [Symmachiella dynata]|uniref:tetratricopeptide repeat protein n=1 Tax=Symmachiella dynata TaxID=2527995 RepID=UPI00118C0A52|nr:tetratricopeptide repeat protein [Symmachiella dynata]QDT48351.1 Tetratricopeptide repeat protein [Symmachiella dynata]
MRGFCFVLAISWLGLWLTPDQQGQRLMSRGQFAEAAKRFDDPLRQGVAWYRAGEFEKATQAFSRVSSPESKFNLGNAWLMLGKYDQAIASYDAALETRPDWKAAQENRDLAAARAKLIHGTGGDLGDQREGADKVVFDQDKPPGGQETEVAGAQAMSDAAIQSIWLRQVQTNPADFLKAKFAYQLADGEARDEK